jgi:hypothetical protein
MRSFVESREVTDLMNLPKRFFELCNTLFLTFDGIGAAVEYRVMSKSLRPLFREFLTYLFRRTISFGKVVEHIRPDEITDGVKSIGVYGLHISRRALYRITPAVRELQLILHIEMPQSNAVLYGLHIPNLLALAEATWDVDKRRNIPEDKLNEIKLLLKPVEDVFKILRQNTAMDTKALHIDIERAMENKLPNRLEENVPKLDELIPKIPEQKRVQAEEKAEKVAGQQILECSGSTLVIHSKRAIEFWHLCMRDAGYELAESFDTGVNRGKMSNWIKSLYAVPMTEEEIRARIRYICNEWWRLRGECIVTDKGGTFSIPPTPEFKYFYNQRVKIMGLLEGLQYKTKPVVLSLEERIKERDKIFDRVKRGKR